jgi:hypothetical protein
LNGKSLPSLTSSSASNSNPPNFKGLLELSKNEFNTEQTTITLIIVWKRKHKRYNYGVRFHFKAMSTILILYISEIYSEANVLD